MLPYGVFDLRNLPSFPLYIDATPYYGWGWQHHRTANSTEYDLIEPPFPFTSRLVRAEVANGSAVTLTGEVISTDHLFSGAKAVFVVHNELQCDLKTPDTYLDVYIGRGEGMLKVEDLVSWWFFEGEWWYGNTTCSLET